MAEPPYNNTQPKLRREKSPRKEKPVNAQNIRRDESLASAQWNILDTERKKHKKKNRKKKTPEVNAAVGASSSGAVIPQESVEGRSADNDAPTPSAVILDPQQKKVLEQNHIHLLDKKSARNSKALFQCKLCKYYCDNMTMVERHILNKRHHRAVEEEADRVTILNLPPATPEQLKYLDNLLREEVRLHGLSDTDILARQNIAAVLGNTVEKMMPGFTVRLYGSSVSGFGLKNSDVNLDLSVPQEKSPAQGLAAASDLIASQEAYSKVERDFNAEIPRVRFIDNGTNLPCTLTLHHNHSYKIAMLLSQYVSIDEHVRMLGIAFRLWAQRCRLDNAEAGMWPPYAFSLLVVYFLQQLRNPVLPVLHELQTTAGHDMNPDVYLDAKDLEGVWKCENTMSLGELWLELFRFYALDFDVLGRVVCIEQSAPLLQNSNAKRWAGRKIAVRDPFLPKRNVTRTMSTQASFEYCMTCFRNTCKYFGILRTKSGPIFDAILLDIPETVSLLHAEKATAEKIVKNATNNHRHFTKNDTTIITVREVEEELRRASLEECKTRPNLVSVSLQKAQEMYSSFSNTPLHYEFHAENFIGNQKYPEICSYCQKEGHSKDQCKEEQLADFDITLPPMEEHYKEILDKLCAHTLAKWSITPEEVEKRERIVLDIQEYILQYYPTAKLELFGSTCNGFGLLKSDIDICLTFTDSETGKEHDFVKVIEDLQDKLKKLGVMSNLVPITTAKVPILKFYHIPSELEGDISIYNTLGQQNTKLLRTYAEIDPRAKMLGYMLKRFAKVCDMCDASRGSLSSYAYILMVIYFLQQCSPPVLPVLQELSETQPKPHRFVEGCDTYFYEDLGKLEKLWPDYGKNMSSVGELWIQLLCFYSGQFDFGMYVISIRQRERLPRFEKLWMSKCMAIEDPFDLSHNLGVGLSRNMHIYIIKSFRKGYVCFGIPPPDTAVLTESPEEYFFKSENLTSGNPPNDRGCRICKKIGHLQKDCPQRRQGRRKKSEHNNGAGRGGAAGGRKRPESSTVHSFTVTRSYNPTNTAHRGCNPPFGLLQSSMHGAQFSRGRFRNPGGLPPYKGGYNPACVNFKFQDRSGMRYGMPHASPPPFKTCASPMGMNRKVNASSLPPFGSIQGSMVPVFGNEQVNVTGKQLPVGTYTAMRPEQRVQECYDFAHRLGLIRNKNLSNDLNHLRPKGEVHCVSKVPGNVVVRDVLPPGLR